jgi:LysM repeat protein
VIPNMRPSPNLVGDSLKAPDIPRQVGEVAQSVQSQLTSTIDVKAAHQWVQPSGGEMHLPKFSFGTEGASLQAVIPGGEQHAMAAAHQVGNQAISPIIQMIMKMPGHIGLISSFFEALSSFFAPVQDLIGGLDVSLFTANAEAAASVVGGSGEHFGLDLSSLIPEDAPIFNMEDGGGGFSDLLPKDASAALNGGELNFNSSEPQLDTGSNPLNTSGYSDAAGTQFEQAPGGLESVTTHVQNGVVTPQYLAMDNGQAIFRPTLGGFNNLPNSPIQVPPNMPPVQPTVVHPLTHQIAPHHPVVSARDVAPTASQLPEQPAYHLPEHAANPVNHLPEHAANPVNHAPEHTSNPVNHPREHAVSHAPEHTVNPVNHSPEHAVNHAPEHSAPHHVEQAADRGTLLGHPHTRMEHSVDQVTAEHRAPSDAQHAPIEKVAEAPAEQGSEQVSTYTVKPGDNLWDIAQHHFGDGLKWQELYQLNHDLIGADPTIIHPGTELQIPGGHELASNYTVQPGDNLWDISKAHLGGGQHWGELFHQNSDVIGSNPGMIHPGQHLSMGGEHAGQQLASAGQSHAAAAQHASSRIASHAAQAAHAPQLAHTPHTPAHHVASHHGATDHAKVASSDTHAPVTPTHQVTAGSQQVPQALAANPSGQDAGLHASVGMGSLETSAHTQP